MDLLRDEKAIEWNTLPKYVYQNVGGEWRNFEGEIIGAPLVNPLTFYLEQNRDAVVPLSLSEDDILTPFTVHNRALHQVILDVSANPLFLKTALGTTDEVTGTILGIWATLNNEADRNELFSQLGAEREAFQRAYAANAAERTAYELAAPFTISAFKQDMSSDVVSFESVRGASDSEVYVSLLGLLDRIIVDEELPLVTTLNYYKVLKFFPYSIDTPADENTMFAYIEGNRVVVTWNGSFSAPQFTTTLPVSGKDSERIKNIFNSHIRPVRIDQLGQVVSGSYTLRAPYKSSVRFNKSIWADLVMNNPFVSEDFVIDEHARATKMVKSVYMFWLNGGKKLVFTLTEQVELDVASQENRAVMRVRVMDVDRAKHNVDIFLERISKVLGLYDEAASGIARYYNALISVPILFDAPVEQPSRVRLKQLDAEMFLPGYSRVCQHLPTVVTDRRAEELERKGYQVMLFPRGAAQADGSNQHYFSCAEQEEHIYPGLRKNSLGNREVYPYLPCCYKQDHTKKNNEYFSNEAPAANVGGGSTRYLVTDKFARAGQSGQCPEKIVRFLEAADAGDAPRGAYTRNGVARSQSSIIDCIFASTRPAEWGALTPAQKAARTEKARKYLAGLGDASLAVFSQETYDWSAEQTRAFLAQGYLDPVIAFSLLEAQFKCRLVLFSRDDFVIPRFAGAFLSPPSLEQIILIYINQGSDADKAEYPQCELIEGARATERIWNLYRESFLPAFVSSTGTLGEFIPENLNSNSHTIPASSVRAQLVDDNGKTFAFYLVDRRIFLCSQPLAPLQLRIFRPEKDKINIAVPNDLINTLELPGKMGGSVISGKYYASRELRRSLLNQYTDVQKQSILFIENVLHSASAAVAREEKFSVGESDNAAAPVYPVSQWAVRALVGRGDQEAARRAEFVARHQQLQRPLEFERYKDYKIVPNTYRNIFDFKQSPNVVIATTNYKVQWKTNTFIIDLEPTPGSACFVSLQEKVYFCVPISGIPPGAPIRLFIWNSKEIIEMPRAAQSVLVFVRGAEKFYFYMNLVSADDSI